MRLVETKDGKSYLLPFILVTSLFFLWGFAHSILDVLNKHFQDVEQISKARSAMIQAVVYGGYFLMALPAGAFIRKYGYRKGVILGLLLYALGAFLFVPGSAMGSSFEFFLLSLFIVGCGLTCLETAANPYVTVLGDPRHATSRLNLAQSFNGLGWILGPLVGGMALFSGNEANIALPYGCIACVVVLVAIFFMRVRLPEIKEEEMQDTPASSEAEKGLWSHPHFTWGVIALFCYVAAQTGINSFFINYATESSLRIGEQTASQLLAFGGMGLFMAGRLSGSWLMSRMAAERLLLCFACGAALCMALVCTATGWLSVIALFTCYLFESIMFPTLFALAIHGVGQHTKRASSFLIMSIVGGAIAPVLMGLVGESEMRYGFIIPLCCFLVIGGYALRYRKLCK